MTQNPRLSEDEVLERLDLCTNSDVISEMYSLGQGMTKEIIDSIRVLESKATSFAAYGAAIVTLLVSSYATWSKLGNSLTPWVSAGAGLTAFMCVVFCVRVISLKQYEVTSQDEWMNKECLQEDLKMKKYHILTMWGTMDSRFNMQLQKLRELRHAFYWIKASVVLLVYLLIHLAFIQSIIPGFLLTLGDRVGVGNILRVALWQTVCGGLICALVLWLTLALFFWYDRRLV